MMEYVYIFQSFSAAILYMLITMITVNISDFSNWLEEYLHLSQGISMAKYRS